MKVCELASKTFDRIILYKRNGEDYVDIFKGLPGAIPDDMLRMEVSVFGSKRKGILDIEVSQEVDYA